MSRSYRKPWYTCGYGSNGRRLEKRFANKCVRRTAEVQDGMAYKRCWDSYAICDGKCMRNPYPKYYWYKGEMKVLEPEPLWKVNRK